MLLHKDIAGRVDSMVATARARREPDATRVRFCRCGQRGERRRMQIRAGDGMRELRNVGSGVGHAARSLRPPWACGLGTRRHR